MVSDGNRVLMDSEEAGDEPFMLAHNLPGIVVLTDKDRVRAGKFAIEEYGVDVLILDDGFQYLPIQADMNLLLVDQLNPFGNQKLLPRGILREPVRHLSRALMCWSPNQKLSRNLNCSKPFGSTISKQKS